MIELTRDTETNPALPKLVIEITNGDLKGIDDVMAKWNFADIPSMLRFAIAVLLSAEKNKLYAYDKEGKKITLTPAANLFAPTNSEPTENAENGDAAQSEQ